MRKFLHFMHWLSLPTRVLLSLTVVICNVRIPILTHFHRRLWRGLVELRVIVATVVILIVVVRVRWRNSGHIASFLAASKQEKASSEPQKERSRYTYSDPNFCPC